MCEVTYWLSSSYDVIKSSSGLLLGRYWNQHCVISNLLRLEDAYNANDKIFVCSNTLSSNDPTITRCTPTINPKDLIGCTLLKKTEADGQGFSAQILRAIIAKNAELKRDSDHIKFLCEVDGDTADDIYTYNQALDFIDRDCLAIESNTGQMYRFRCISAHQ
jgi:hypothetical protein